MKPHKIEFKQLRGQQIEVKCACGYKDIALSKADARRLAIKHIDVERAKEIAGL